MMLLTLVALGIYVLFLCYLKLCKKAGHDEPFSMLGYIYIGFCCLLCSVFVVGFIEKALAN